MTTDRELNALMAEAAQRATERALAAGYGRSHRVTKASALAAALEVQRRERPEGGTAVPLIADPAKDRLEREEEPF